DPARDRRRHMGRARARPRPARPRAECLRRRHLRSGPHPEGRRRAPRHGAELAAVPARGGRDDAAARVVHHRRRHRSRARRGRPLLRPRGQRADAVGRLLRPREPRRHGAPRADVAAHVRRAERRELSRGPPREPVRARAGRGAAPDRRALDAGHVQLRVLRARRARAAHGRRAGRGSRPRLRRPRALHADGARPEAHSRPLPPDRRLLPRPGRFPPRLAARRPRPRRRDARRHGSGRERHRDRRRGRQGDLRLHAGDDPLLPRRGPAAPDRRDASPARRRRPARGPARPRPLRREAHRRIRRLRRGHRAEVELPRAGACARPHRARSQELHRPARDPALRPSRRDRRERERRRPHPAAPRRPAPVRAPGGEAARPRGRPDARRAPRGVADRELVAGRRQQGHLGARGLSVLRRIADSLFWAARSLERAEWRARLVDVDYRLLVETPVELSQPWTPLLAIAGEEAAFAERWGEPDETKILEFFLFDRGNPSSIRACIETARENTRTLRHTISSELWLDLNTLYLDSQRWSLRELESGGLFGFFSDLRERFYRLSGIVSATLPRDLGYDFLTLGTMLERADNVTRLLDVKYHVLLPDVADVGGPIDLLQWAAVLRSASGLEAYRRAHGNAIRLDRVVDLLLFDATFARSARFCVERVGGALARIAGGTPSASRRAADELAERLACASAADAIAGGLHEFVVGAQSQCADVASAVFDDYLRFE